MLKRDEWLTKVQVHPFLDIVNNYTRIPSKEDLKAFEARLRASGLVGGKFEGVAEGCRLDMEIYCRERRRCQMHVESQMLWLLSFCGGPVDIWGTWRLEWNGLLQGR
jgi:hypothetical protein